MYYELMLVPNFLQLGYYLHSDLELKVNVANKSVAPALKGFGRVSEYPIYGKRGWPP
jgi:hypothetical protein